MQGEAYVLDDSSSAGELYYGPFRVSAADDSVVDIAVPDGRVVKSGSGFAMHYFTTDHLGSTRLVTDASGNVLEQFDYLPYGEKCNNSGLAVANQHKTDYLYGGKEKPQLFGIDWYDSAARWQTTSGIFVSPDPLMEKYYSISPYAYCAGNPVNLVDPEGREIYVSKEYQEQFMSDLQNVFGDKVKFFYFNDEGLLQLNSSAKEFRKGLSKDQKGAFKGLNKAMSDKEVTSIVYSDFFDVTMGGTAKTVDVVLQFGGGLYSKTENLIVIAPSVGDVNVTVFDSNYIGEQTIKQNTTSVLFHEIGERNTKDEHYRGDVVDYENYARRVLGLPIRPYDLFHSHTVPQN